MSDKCRNDTLVPLLGNVRIFKWQKWIQNDGIMRIIWQTWKRNQNVPGYSNYSFIFVLKKKNCSSHPCVCSFFSTPVLVKFPKKLHPLTGYFLSNFSSSISLIICAISPLIFSSLLILLSSSDCTGVNNVEWTSAWIVICPSTVFSSSWTSGSSTYCNIFCLITIFFCIMFYLLHEGAILPFMLISWLFQLILPCTTLAVPFLTCNSLNSFLLETHILLIIIPSRFYEKPLTTHRTHIFPFTEVVFVPTMNTYEIKFSITLRTLCKSLSFLAELFHSFAL